MVRIMSPPVSPEAGVTVHQVFSALAVQALLAVKVTDTASLPSAEIEVTGSISFSIFPVVTSVESFPSESELHPHVKRKHSNSIHLLLSISHSIKLLVL